MGNQVYANNMEVSCKAAAGKAICAMPDVCMTPPQTPATPPGVPIPYPNTGLSSDCSDGSSTVQISNQEVMLKNKSYFKKSTGDEAGCAPMKGVISTTNTGKVYFNAWSMDVQVESENVVRHLDLTTHNHASLPGNTPPWPYLDEMAFTSPKTDENPCGDIASKAQDKCGKHVQTTKGKDPKIKRKPTNDAMCADVECKKALKCVLSPYAPSNCCDGKTGHHVIPAHCFMPPGTRSANGEARYEGCKGYEINEAPCICVDGEGKEKEHGEIHKIVDDAEDKFLKNGKDGGQKAGSWTYEQASNESSKAVSQVTKCDQKCIKAQVDAYHQQKSGSPNISSSTKLRADSSGNRLLSSEVPLIAPTNLPAGIGFP